MYTPFPCSLSSAHARQKLWPHGSVHGSSKISEHSWHRSSSAKDATRSAIGTSELASLRRASSSASFASAAASSSARFFRGMLRFASFFLRFPIVGDPWGAERDEERDF